MDLGKLVLVLGALVFAGLAVFGGGGTDTGQSGINGGGDVVGPGELEGARGMDDAGVIEPGNVSQARGGDGLKVFTGRVERFEFYDGVQRDAEYSLFLSDGGRVFVEFDSGMGLEVGSGAPRYRFWFRERSDGSWLIERYVEV